MKDVLKDISMTALWVGGSAAITYICTAVLNRPDLSEYYGVVNIVLYALKVVAESRKLEVDNSTASR